MPHRARLTRRSLARLGSYVAVVFFLLTLNFLLPRVLPGRPIAALSDPRSATYVGDDARRAAVERYYGLDRPLLTQYGSYLAGLSRGDLGTSIRFNAPVTRLLAQRLPWTLLLVTAALVLATAVGVLAGVHSGWRRDSAADHGLLGLFLTIENFPVYFLASVGAYFLSVKLGWFPLLGAQTQFVPTWGALRRVADVAHHLVLPAGVLALQFGAYQYLTMRAAMVAELGADHLVLGRAKGLADRTLKYRYAARNALLPTVSVAALQVGYAVVAAIFVEKVFAYPGIGLLMFESVGERDYPVMQGCFLVITLMVVSANLLADLAYRRLDPRASR